MTIRNAFVAPEIGDTVSFSKTMSVAEQAMFTGISGNLGPLYVNRDKARSSGLADMAVFEMAAASLLSTCLSRLAGPGYRIASFHCRFDRPVTVGSTLSASATLLAQNADSLVFALSLLADDEPAASGEAVLQNLDGG
jgi:acyl dehydratase